MRSQAWVPCLLFLLASLVMTSNASSSPWSAYTALSDTQLQYDVGTCGDINNDGFDEIILISNGTIYVVYGGVTVLYSSTLDFVSEADVVISTTVDNFLASSYMVHEVGDIDKDGYGDFWVQSYLTNNSLVFYGGSDIPSTISTDTLANPTGSRFICGVAWVMEAHLDFDGDGNIDLVLGDYLLDTVVVIYGTGSKFGSTVDCSTLNINERFVFSGNGGTCGYSIESAGDVNQDGYDDLLVSCLSYNSPHGGSVLLWGGARPRADVDLSTMTPSDGVIISTSESFQYYNGYSLGSADDFNGDGIRDLVIGAPNNYITTIYILYGSTSFPATLDLYNITAAEGIMVKGKYGDYLAQVSSIAIADLNQDGYSDVVAGRGGADSNKGTVLIIWGGPNLPRELQADTDTTNIYTIYGKDFLEYTYNAFFGVSLVLSDYDGDGRPDLFVT